MKRFYSFFILLVACLMTVSVRADEKIVLNQNITQGLEPGTTYFFYDSGDEAGQYSSYESYTATLTNAGDIIINFSEIATESSSNCSPWDYMLIYDGDATTGVEIGRVQSGCSSSLVTGTDYVATSGKMTIVWKSDSGTNGNGWAAKITAAEPPACPPLVSISVSDLTRRSMTVNLNLKTGTELGSYELVYADKEIEDLDGAPKIEVNAASYELTGLERETTYHIYVRANCGEDGTSDWVSTVATTKGLSGCDEIPVGDGTSSEYGPISGYYGYERNGYIFTPADGLSAGSISQIAWNYAVVATIPAKIYIKNTDATAFESTLVWNQLIADATLVYDASITLKAGWNEFTFSSPFDYTGGNLMVLVESNYGGSGGGTAKAFYSTSSNSDSHFYIRKDTSIDDDAEYSTFGTKGINNYRHDIKFTSCYSSVACPTVTNMTSELLNEGTTSARISWTASDADYLSGYEIVRSETEITDFSGVTTEQLAAKITSVEFNDLEAAHQYFVYVRAICQAGGKDEGSSEWVGVNFTTNADCPAVQNLAVTLAAANTIDVQWDLAFAEQQKHFACVLSEVELDAAGLAAATKIDVDDTTHIQIPDNAFDKEYHIYIASKCGEALSDFVHASVTTLPSCQAVENLTVVRVAHNLVELSWESAQFATETQWEVGIVGDEANAQIVDERHAKLFGLNVETEYQAYVKAKCSDTEFSGAVTTDPFTTAAKPGNCKQVGNGTYSDKSPFTNWDYAYAQIIYPASELQSGKIVDLKMKRASGTSTMNNIKVYLGTTSKSTFDSKSDWIPEEDLTLVFDGSIKGGSTAGDDTIICSTPFVYNGVQNLVVAVSNGHGKYSEHHSMYYTSTASSVLVRRKDGDATYALHPGTREGETPSSYRTNIEFCFEDKACPNVDALTASNITTSEATISWEPMGSETAWNIFVSTDEVTDFSDLSGYEVEQVNALSKKFTALLDDQDYFAYVQPVCDGAEFSALPFRTIASCKAMISPAVVSETITAHTARVTWVDPNPLKAGSYTVAYEKKDIFNLNSGAYLTINATDTFVDLIDLQQDTVYRFAVMATCNGDDPSRYSVAANFTTLESCFNPTAPAVLESSITAHEATVYWKDTHDDAGYIVAYGPYDDFDINNPETYKTDSVLADTFVVLDQLLAATKYAFKVKGDCSSVGEGMSNGWTYTQDFTTGCEAKAVPYTEGFEKSDALFCWTVGNVQSTASSYIPSRSTSAKATDSYGLELKAYKYISTYSVAYNTDADSAYAVLPELDFGAEGIGAHQIRFNAKSFIPYSGTYYQHIRVCVAEDNVLTNLELIKDIEVTGEFEEYEISFAEYTGAGNRIVLLVVVDPESTANTRTAQIYVDDIYVSHLASCKRVASINEPTDEDITSSSATISWIPEGDETDFQFIVVRAGVEPDWSAAKDVTGTSATVDTLIASTNYDFYVRTNCGSEQSDPRSISFRTECDVVVVDANNEFFEDFDASDALACWEAPIENISSTDRQWVLSTSQHYSGSASVYSGFYGPIYVITPEIAITNEANRNVELTFWSYNSWPSDYDKNSVVVMGETEVELWSPESVVESWEEATISLNDYKGQTIRLGFKYEGNNSHGWYVDDVRIAFGPKDPTALDNTGIDTKAIKRLENGVLVIELDGTKYNAQGMMIRK